MIAEHCRLVWECRAGRAIGRPPSWRRAWRRLRPPACGACAACAPEVAIRTERRSSVPPFVAVPNSPAVAWRLRLDRPRPLHRAAPFTSEAGLFQRAGIPAVVCGPGRLSEAHQPDEFVTARRSSPPA